MKDKLKQIQQKALSAFQDAREIKDVDDLKVKFLGKKGELTAILKEMGKLSAEERPVIGQMANEVRQSIEKMLEESKKRLEAAELAHRLEAEKIDVTMPGKERPEGHKHPMSIVIDEICDIFKGMGYEVADGPEVEKDYYNFEALNIPANHPAKDEQDTFYINGIFCCVHRPLPCRCVPWKRASCRFVWSAPVRYIVPMRWMQPIPLYSISWKAW